MLLFAMIRSVVKSFKVSDVDVVAARMSNELLLLLFALGLGSSQSRFPSSR